MLRRIGMQAAGAFMVLALVACLGAAHALAAQSPDYSKTGSIGLTFVHDGQPAQVGSVALYRIALVAGLGSEAQYEPVDALKGGSLKLADITSASAARSAADAADAAGLEPLAVLEAGSDGSVRFGGLASGLYLVEQQKSNDGFSFSAFLVSIPYRDYDEYVYDVDATPKVALSQETEEFTDEPTPLAPGTPDEDDGDDGGSDDGGDTPDETVDIPDDDVPTAENRLPQTGQLNWPIPVLGIGGAAFLLLGLALRRSARGR